MVRWLCISVLLLAACQSQPDVRPPEIEPIGRTSQVLETLVDPIRDSSCETVLSRKIPGSVSLGMNERPILIRSFIDGQSVVQIQMSDHFFNLPEISSDTFRFRHGDGRFTVVADLREVQRYEITHEVAGTLSITDGNRSWIEEVRGVVGCGMPQSLP